MNSMIFLLKAYLEKKQNINNLGRGLIILDILEFIKSSIPNEKRSMVIFVFSKIQKTFSTFRINSAEDNERELIKLDSIYNSLDADLKFYLSLSYLPMRSYYYYSISNFKLAIDDLENFINNSNIILKNNPKLKTSVNFEQLLNLFRIHFTSRDFSRANNSAAHLIMFSLYNNQAGLIKGFNITDIDNKFQWTSHIVESIIIKYLHENNLIDLIELIDIKPASNSDTSFHLGFRFLQAYYNENFEEAKNCFIKLLKTTDESILPDILLSTILLKFEEIITKEDTFYFDDFKKIFHSFATKKIKDNKKLESIFLLNVNELKMKN